MLQPARPSDQADCLVIGANGLWGSKSRRAAVSPCYLFRKPATVLTPLLLALTNPAPAETTATLLHHADRGREQTTFQTAAHYSPAVDIRSDAAMVYGVNDTLSSRVAGWKEQGYRISLMTGSAWGQYEDYIDGRFDGRRHDDEGQVDPQGQVIWHHPGVPYMVPTPSFVEYLKSLSRKAIDAGATGLYLEEPEFWSRAGYSQGFQKLWQAEYKEPWVRPDSSPDAFWRSSKLKYLLYRRTLEQVFQDAVTYARSRGTQVRCYVPTHSLVSYSQWGIVSPMTSLMDMANCDGYIAQVWTGTARSPNTYRGVTRERTFETGCLEYASMHSMVAPTGRTVYFLADPVEDDPNHTWDDYRFNYRRTVAASLLFPDVNHFEVMPWPDRVMTGTYPAGTYRQPGGPEKITIPPDYASELMTVVNALATLRPDPAARFECGTTGIALLISDTLMFQRSSPWSSSGTFDDFFGLAMPLIKAGLPPRCVVLEQVLEKRAFDGVKVLLASYEPMKPLRPEYNQALADWVKGGGTLIYFGSDTDAFHQVREWWNHDGAETTASTARADLFRRLGVAEKADPGFYPSGKGSLVYSSRNPGELARTTYVAADAIHHLIDKALALHGEKLQVSGHLLVERDGYLIGGVLDEPGPAEPLKLTGSYLNLFSSNLDIVRDPSFQASDVFLLRRLPRKEFEPVASNLRVEQFEQVSPRRYRLEARGPATVTTGTVALSLPAAPGKVSYEGTTPATPPPPAASRGDIQSSWDPETHVAHFRFPNRPGGVVLTFELPG